MSFYLTQAISLHRRPVGERDTLVSLFSFDRGRILVKARGTRKPASTLRPAAEPLNEGLYYLARRRGTDLLTQWAPLCHFVPVRRDPAALSHALYFLQFPQRLLPPAQPEPAAYFLLKNCLLTLSACPEYHITRAIFEIGFLEITGHAMNFARCAQCASAVRESRCMFNIQAGGPLCEVCAKGRETKFSLPFGLAAAKLGKNGNRVATLFASGALASGDPQTCVPLRDAVAAVAKGADAVALRQLRTVITQFLYFHYGEPVERWFIEI